MSISGVAYGHGVADWVGTSSWGSCSLEEKMGEKEEKEEATQVGQGMGLPDMLWLAWGWAAMVTLNV